MKNNYRDAQLIPIHKDAMMIMACDSCGGIGEKEHDFVKMPPFIAGKYTARVSIMEVLSLGAEVIGMSINICNEPYPTGDEILKGIDDEMKESGLNLPITISTEKNMKTSMTALGVSVVGICKSHDLLMHKAWKKDYVYVIGIPKVGDEVAKDQGEIATVPMLRKILKKHGIKEVIPIGSSGIQGEMDQLLKGRNLSIDHEENITLNIEKSAGPSTAILVVSSHPIKEETLPVQLIGQLK